MAADLGILPYREAHDLQLHILRARRRGSLGRDVLLLLEHMPVFTLGRKANRANLLVDDALLRRHCIELIHVERGGDITYHGPGQLVAYFLIETRRWKRLDLGRFVRSLESVMIDTTEDFGVPAVRDPKNPGIWTGGRKLGSIGIAIRNRITFHGLALNVHTDLSFFQWIHPCGLNGVSMTSLAEETGRYPSMDEVKKRLSFHVQSAFSVCLHQVSAASLREALPDGQM
jgi:lipoate-protein ligase B